MFDAYDLVWHYEKIPCAEYVKNYTMDGIANRPGFVFVDGKGGKVKIDFNIGTDLKPLTKTGVCYLGHQLLERVKK